MYDSFGRLHNYLRISLTDACNLRCKYCMPENGISFTKKNKLMSPDEIDCITSVFVELGVNKIRITGGEPLLRKDFTEIIYKLSRQPVELTITTNALLADKYINVFKASGIKTINVSLDTLSPEEFFLLTKRNQFNKIYSNILLLLKNNFKIKLNFVVMKNVNVSSIPEFVELTKDYPFEIRFIEFMPFTGNNWKNENVFSYDNIIDLIQSKYTISKIEDSKHDTAKKYRADGHLGTFGIIGTITKPFCNECNRLRLTADGKLKNCLFSNGETDLLTPFRNNEDIVPFIYSSLSKKMEERGGQFDKNEIQNRSMVSIGG